MQSRGILAVMPIEKEKLSEMHFTKDDVLSDPVKIRLRNIYLTKAQKLGNVYKGKVKITFVSRSGEHFLVETTIWTANEEYISLKGGVMVPTKSIIDISFS